MQSGLRRDSEVQKCSKMTQLCVGHALGPVSLVQEATLPAAVTHTHAHSMGGSARFKVIAWWLSACGMLLLHVGAAWEEMS